MHLQKNNLRRTPLAGPPRLADSMDVMADATDSSPPPRRLQISKYPNRRYYDKTRGRHLTLEQLHAAIRDGYEIQVTDSKSGEDITARILAQIILEHDAPKLSVFPVELLHRLLRSNQDLVRDFTQKYFSGALSAFLESQKKTEEYLRQAMGLQPSMMQMPNWAKMMWGPFHPAAWTGQEPPSGPAQAPPELNAQLEQLQAELQKAQARLATARAKRPRKGRKSPKK